MLNSSVKRKPGKSQKYRDINPYLRQVVRSFRPTILAVFFFSFFINLLTLALPIYLLQIYSKVVPSKNVDTLLYLTGIALVAILFLGVLESLRRSLLVKAGTRFEFLLGEHVLNSAIHRSLVKSYTSVSVLRELTRVRNFISGTSLIPILDVPWSPLFLLILFALHPYIGFIGIVGALIMIALALINESASRNLMENAIDSSNSNTDMARAYIKNSHAVQAMGMQKYILPRWKNDNISTLNKGVAATGLNTRISSLSKSVRLCLQIIIICVAAWLIVKDELTAGATIASVLLLRRAISPLEGSIKSWKSIVASRQAFFNISEYLDHASTFDNPKPMPTPKGDLQAKNLSYRPSGHKKSLFSKVNITLQPGVITALVGSTAAGKSTILKILCGIIPPSSGKVTLGGYELNQWDAETLGQHIGYLPQDVALFPGTVRENIGRMADVPIGDAIKAAKLAYCHELIQQLPQGYETMVEEDGQNLSGGQKQRIGLARALFGNPAAVFLDEPDANLDSSGRRSLRRCFQKLKRENMAVLVVTHQRSIEKASDVVYKLKDGGLTKSEPKAAANKTAAISTDEELTPTSINDDIHSVHTEASSRAELFTSIALKAKIAEDRKSDLKNNENALSILANDAPLPQLESPEQRVKNALEKLAAIRQQKEKAQ